MDYGKAIYSIRKHRNWSQEKFSTRVGIDQSYLSLVENNKKRPSTKMIEKISNTLGVPMPIIFFFSLSENDVPQEKRELFNMIYPRMKEMLYDFFEEIEVNDQK